MFTGIIQYLGTVESARKPAGRLTLSIQAGPIAQDARVGDSICVRGVCLTVAETRGSLLAFDAIGETLSRTTLGQLTKGDPVNLEPSLKPSDRMGGHFVTGHIDGTAVLSDVTETPGELRQTFQADPSLCRMMIPKGSVAIDGVSLTLTDVAEASFAVALIPHTLSVTTLGSIHPGECVNVETDLIGKWVLKALGGSGRALTEEFLREYGFA